MPSPSSGSEEGRSEAIRADRALAILALMANRTARRLRSEETRGEALVKRLIRHRMATQMIGVVSIFVTAMYGMYTNLYVGPFSF